MSAAGAAVLFSEDITLSAGLLPGPGRLGISSETVRGSAFSPFWAADAEDSRTAGKSPGLEEPRPLGTGRRVRACEAPGLAHRAPLPLLSRARSRSRSPPPPPLEGRATLHVVCDCWLHVGGAPLSQRVFRPEHVGRIVAGLGEKTRLQR